MNNQGKWGVIVIGGGPAGMMAAIQAAQKGCNVLLLEKNDKLGKKLLITGGGRCNVTNAEFDTRTLLEKYKGAKDYLFSSFSLFGVKDTFDFFHARRVPTKVEAEKRAFPSSDKAESIWQALVDDLYLHKVIVRSNTEVKSIIKDGDKISGVLLTNNEILEADSYILATGGTSRPETGSTGDGFNWLQNLGHKINSFDPSLVPVAIQDNWVKELQGITLDNIKISVYQDKEKQLAKKGKILFTHFGVSGPTILNMSRTIGELLDYGEVILELDLLPGSDYSQLNKSLQDLCVSENKKMLKNSLSVLIPSSLVPIVLEKSGISGDTTGNNLTRSARLALVQMIKHLPMSVDKLLGVDKAIVSSGGVDIDQIDFRTMRSRLFPNLYIIGDLLDIDRPSGGYSLQLCWTTGYVAGTSAAKQPVSL